MLSHHFHHEVLSQLIPPHAVSSASPQAIYPFPGQDVLSPPCVRAGPRHLLPLPALVQPLAQAAQGAQQGFCHHKCLSLPVVPALSPLQPLLQCLWIHLPNKATLALTRCLGLCAGVGICCGWGLSGV